MRTMNRNGIVVAVAALAVAVLAGCSGTPDPAATVETADPAATRPAGPDLDANTALVTAFYDAAINQKDYEAASKYLGERYIQHNPNVPDGLAAVMKFFGSRKPAPIPDAKSWRTKVVSVVADDDLVVVALARELPDPRKPKATYTTTWFDMWRIRDGKADEHWDYGTIAPPAPPAQ